MESAVFETQDSQEKEARNEPMTLRQLMEKGGLVSQAVPKKSGAFFGRSRQNQLE